MDGGRDFGGVENAVRPLGDRLDGVELVVDFVEHTSVHADEVALYLSGDYQDGGRGGVGSADGGAGVLEAGARDDEGGSDAASGAGVAVCHVGCGLFVSGVYESDSGFLGESVEGVVELDAGESEDDADAFAVEGFGQGLAACHFWHLSNLQSGFGVGYCWFWGRFGLITLTLALSLRERGLLGGGIFQSSQFREARWVS